MALEPENLLEHLRKRGFLHQLTDEAGLQAALSKGPVTYYAGFDPTGPSLHAGHLLPLMAMAWLARAGHTAIAVVGGGTAQVGDPSGKDATRDLLSLEALQANKASIAAQIRRFAPEASLEDNAAWLEPLSYITFLRDIGRHFSINRMLSAESVKLRLERDQGLSFIEFNYVLLQSYDFLELYRRRRCTLQIGGADQWFNIVSGMDLIRRLEGGEAFGLTIPLLTTASGAKMGKTADGAVWLDAERFSPYHYFQYWYNVDDRDVERFLKLYTFLSLEEIAAVMAGDIRAAKRRLAREATAVVHGEEAAAAADDAAKAAFAGGAAENMPTWATPFPVDVVKALVGSGLAKSNSDARRQIQGGAVKWGSEKVTDPALLLAEPGVLWMGKKSAVRLVSEA